MVLKITIVNNSILYRTTQQINRDIDTSHSSQQSNSSHRNKRTFQCKRLLKAPVESGRDNSYTYYVNTIRYYS